jgi:hypothetical protein
MQDEGLTDADLTPNQNLEETPVVVATEPVVEPTEMVEPTATMEMTATTEANAEATPQVAAEAQGTVALASNVIGATIWDNADTQLGTIDELLANQNGEIQYVIVDATAIDLTNGNDTADNQAAENDAFDLFDQDQSSSLDEDEFNAAVNTAGLDSTRSCRVKA